MSAYTLRVVPETGMGPQHQQTEISRTVPIATRVIDHGKATDGSYGPDSAEFGYSGGFGVAYSPKADPYVMRVYGAVDGKETRDGEATNQTAQSGADYSKASRSGHDVGGGQDDRPST